MVYPGVSMFSKICFMICAILPMGMFAQCDQEDKIYVRLSDLFFDETGIWFINSAEPAIRGTEAIHVDSHGYYMTKKEETWKCPKCGKINSGHPAWGCSKCAWPFDGD